MPAFSWLSHCSNEEILRHPVQGIDGASERPWLELAVRPEGHRPPIGLLRVRVQLYRVALDRSWVVDLDGRGELDVDFVCPRRTELTRVLQCVGEGFVPALMMRLSRGSSGVTIGGRHLFASLVELSRRHYRCLAAATIS